MRQIHRRDLTGAVPGLGDAEGAWAPYLGYRVRMDRLSGEVGQRLIFRCYPGHLPRVADERDNQSDTILG